MKAKDIRRERVGTPDAAMYDLIFSIVRLWLGRHRSLSIDDHLLKEAEAPYLMLANHESFYDFYYISKLSHPKRPSYLVNEYYCTRPILKHMARRSGILSKKLFTRDMSTAVGLLRMVRKGFPVVIFPEGRLSPDGRSNPIVEQGGALYKKLAVDLVLTRISGAYFAAPKWRKQVYRSRVDIRVVRVIKREELQRMTAQEIDRIIDQALCSDASLDPIDRYPQRNKAVGLETILYRCADCGALYETEGIGSELICRACGRRHKLNEQYRFSDEAGSISTYYERIREIERENLAAFRFTCQVAAKIHGANGGPIRREKGECILTPVSFHYCSSSVDFEIKTEKLPALAFSCGKEFELYFKDELYYFYPTEHPNQVARWALYIDLLQEKRRSDEELEGRSKT